MRKRTSQPHREGGPTRPTLSVRARGEGVADHQRTDPRGGPMSAGSDQGRDTPSHREGGIRMDRFAGAPFTGSVTSGIGLLAGEARRVGGRPRRRRAHRFAQRPRRHPSPRNVCGWRGSIGGRKAPEGVGQRATAGLVLGGRVLPVAPMCPCRGSRPTTERAQAAERATAQRSGDMVGHRARSMAALAAGTDSNRRWRRCWRRETGESR